MGEGANLARTIKEFENDKSRGALQYFPYQFAFGITVRRLFGSNAIRIYFGPLKFWYNWKKEDE